MQALTDQEKEERRAQALLKLAKAMGRGGSTMSTSNTADDDEKEVLEAIMQAKDLEECQRIAQVSRRGGT
jgi:hypothetical protein